MLTVLLAWIEGRSETAEFELLYIVTAILDLMLIGILAKAVGIDIEPAKEAVVRQLKDLP